MGPIGKLLFIAVLIVLAYYAYNEFEIKTVTVCIDDIGEPTDVTCVDNTDCAKFMTSEFGQYPDSLLYKVILTEASECNEGKCMISNFNFKTECSKGESPMSYKLTIKEWLQLY